MGFAPCTQNVKPVVLIVCLLVYFAYLLLREQSVRPVGKKIYTVNLWTQSDRRTEDLGTHLQKTQVELRAGATLTAATLRSYAPAA